MIVTSISANEPLPNLMISNALRPGLHGLVNALSREVAAEGVTVNAIMPGYTLNQRIREIGIEKNRRRWKSLQGAWGGRKNLPRSRYSWRRKKPAISAARRLLATGIFGMRFEYRGRRH